MLRLVLAPVRKEVRDFVTVHSISDRLALNFVFLFHGEEIGEKRKIGVFEKVTDTRKRCYIKNMLLLGKMI